MKKEEARNIVKKARRKGFYQWQIAEAMGISESTLCKWLRQDLSQRKEDMFIGALTKLTGERTDYNSSTDFTGEKG